MPALAARLRSVAPAVDHIQLRVVDERSEELTVEDDVVRPPTHRRDRGAMVTVVHRGGLGYAATPDLSESGLRRAARRAKTWAERTADHAITDFSAVPWARSDGRYATDVRRPWGDLSVADKIDLLRSEVTAMGGDARVVRRSASLMRVAVDETLIRLDGGTAHTHLELLAPDALCVAHDRGLTQHRSYGLRGICQQGGLEILDRVGFTGGGRRMRDEAIELLAAPTCPSGPMDIVLAPDQMMLQIHESIGHPLELDRILGDERNYAGTSFVTPDMFGSYRYGSDLLDVTFDPTVPGEFASYGFDADGAPAERRYLIRQGVLLRPLGGTLSQHRATLPGVANSRASSWNRPPIDRMANLNVEPGPHSLDQLIGQVERGVWMQTNVSWSIDDSRNKFQFGCEVGRLIEDGELGPMVRNPNYRGISATFWRSLAGVGDRSTLEVLGTPYCGKGEPNQIIRVGHASPACRFRDIDVFGAH